MAAAKRKRPAAKKTAARRGPKPGARRAAAEARAQEEAGQPTAPLTEEQRQNPIYLSGDELKELGHRKGVARSLMADMSDEKIRMEIRYCVARQVDREAEEATT